MRKISKILLTAAMLLATVSGFANAGQDHITITGKVVSEGKGVAGVAVTDGRTVVQTGSKGEYILKTSSDSKFVYYSLPTGYESPADNGIPQFFQKIDPQAAKQKVNFEITKSDKSQERHTFIVWADPQVLFEHEFDQLKEVVDDLSATAASYDVPVHSISAGDNVFDKMDFFELYKDAVADAGIPFYHVLGNHDMDYNRRSNELSDVSFTDAFGPSHYSFNVGDIHYVVLKDVFYFGYTYQYMGYVTEQQLRWLEADLALVPEGSTVVVSVHIPTHYGDTPNAGSFTTLERNSVMNKEALYKVLEPYNTHIMAGHSHTQWNTIIAPNLFEHTHGAASAAWWQGELCLDGTPKGYTVYEVDGSELTWYFKGVGLDKSEQLRVYYDGEELIANVYNYDPEWTVVWTENGVVMGAMEQFWGVDPMTEELYPRGGNKVHSWLSYGETGHLFKAMPNDKNADLKIVVTDRFGNVYVETADEWKLVWSDEFNYEGLPDETKWSYDTEGNSWGWGNNEAQFYTFRDPRNAYVNDGTLKITAHIEEEPVEGKRYTSARLRTKDKGDWLYGKFEIRAKLPTDRGTWPAIWMLPTDWEYGGWPDSGEIDIMENVGYDADTVLATAHTKTYNHMIGTQTSGKYYLPTASEEFHVYGLEWDENEWRAYIDGNHYYTHKNDMDGFGGWPFDKRFHMIVNLAIGGAWGGAHGIDESDFPKVFEIDYVRVYQKR